MLLLFNNKYSHDVKTHLTPQEVVQVPELSRVGDLSIQWSVAMIRDPSTTANLNTAPPLS